MWLLPICLKMRIARTIMWGPRFQETPWCEHKTFRYWKWHKVSIKSIKMISEAHDQVGKVTLKSSKIPSAAPCRSAVRQSLHCSASVPLTHWQMGIVAESPKNIKPHTHNSALFCLWIWKRAMENGLFIDELPIKVMIFSTAILDCQSLIPRQALSDPKISFSTALHAGVHAEGNQLAEDARPNLDATPDSPHRS